MATDLTTAHPYRVSGERIVDITSSTLAAGQRMVETWSRLEPVVRILTDKVTVYVEGEDSISPKEAGAVLQQIASVVHKIGTTAAHMVKVGEGMARLGVVLEASNPVRRPAKDMTERQLAEVVLATVTRIKEQTGSCPICTETIDASAAVESADGADA